MMSVYALAASHHLPVLAHVSLGSTETAHDLLGDLDLILSAHPTLARCNQEAVATVRPGKGAISARALPHTNAL